MKRNITLWLIFFILITPAYAQQKDYTLNTAFVGPVRSIFESVMTESFKKNGLTVKVNTPTAERALQHANRGIDDGDGPRIAGLSSKYPNLIQVPEKIIDVEFTAFSKNEKIEIDGWDSLKPYRVGILIGWKILETNIKGTKSLRTAKDANALFKMLNNDRIDIAVINKADGLEFIRDKNIKQIKALTPPLAVKEMFLYLHKKHSNLVPKISTTLKEMKDDGSYQKIVDEILN